jgi:hypothetical protein
MVPESKETITSVRESFTELPRDHLWLHGPFLPTAAAPFSLGSGPAQLGEVVVAPAGNVGNLKELLTLFGNGRATHVAGHLHNGVDRGRSSRRARAQRIGFSLNARRERLGDSS